MDKRLASEPGLNLCDMVRDWAISVKTVRRYLDALRWLEQDLAYLKEYDGRYYWYYQFTEALFRRNLRLPKSASGLGGREADGKQAAECVTAVKLGLGLSRGAAGLDSGLAKVSVLLVRRQPLLAAIVEEWKSPQVADTRPLPLSRDLLMAGTAISICYGEFIEPKTGKKTVLVEITNQAKEPVTVTKVEWVYFYEKPLDATEEFLVQHGKAFTSATGRRAIKAEEGAGAIPLTAWKPTRKAPSLRRKAGRSCGPRNGSPKCCPSPSAVARRYWIRSR